jgi:transposase
LAGFAAGLRRGPIAVLAGLTLHWSSGLVEGHVSRIKMPNMRGRAKVDHSRKRVLLG